jgi:hypothetical protein
MMKHYFVEKYLEKKHKSYRTLGKHISKNFNLAFFCCKSKYRLIESVAVKNVCKYVLLIKIHNYLISNYQSKKFFSPIFNKLLMIKLFSTFSTRNKSNPTPSV